MRTDKDTDKKQMDNFRIGCTLLDQIYKEGDSTWGCKSGVLDVEDVKSFIEDLQKFIFFEFDAGSKKRHNLFVKIRELSGMGYS